MTLAQFTIRCFAGLGIVVTLLGVLALLTLFLFGWFRKEEPQWRISRLISPDYTIYVVRDSPGHEREIQHPWEGTWTPESKVKFSHLPIFESYHKQQYKAAKLWKEGQL